MTKEKEYGHGFDTGLVQELADECGSTYEQAEKIVVEFVIPELDGFFERGGKANSREKNDFTMYLWGDASSRLDDLVESEEV